MQDLCSTCRKKIDRNTFNGELSRTSWLRLMSYFDHEYNEQEITQATYDSMINSLMDLKPDDECDHCDAMKEYSKRHIDEKRENE